MLKKLSLFLDSSSRQDQNRNDFDSGNNGQNKSIKANFDFIHLIQNWQKIAGNKLAEHTIPLKNQNGTLIVLSNHSAFASEMKFMEGPLKKKIFEQFPNLENQIKTINFIVDSTHFQTQKNNFSLDSNPKLKKTFIPHPYSPEYKKSLKEAQELFSNIEDAEMKETFVSIYIQNKFKDSR